jgi:hypothetical protein
MFCIGSSIRVFFQVPDETSAQGSQRGLDSSLKIWNLQRPKDYSHIMCL